MGGFFGGLAARWRVFVWSFFFLVALPVAAQTPDCVYSATLSAAGSVQFPANINRACFTWGVSYSSTGFSALSLTFQSAPDSAGTPGVWATFGGTTVLGANPMTAITSTSWAGYGFFPWVRVNLAGLTGTGTVTVNVAGWRIGNTQFGGGGSGPTADVNLEQVAGTATVTGGLAGLLAVAGPVAVGAVVGASNPLMMAANASGVVARVRSDASGYLEPASNNTAATDDLANNVEFPSRGGGALYYRSFPWVFDGTTWDRLRGNSVGLLSQGAGAHGAAVAGNPLRIGGSDGTNTQNLIVCPLRAAIAATGSGDTQIVAASGSALIFVCHISWSSESAVDVKLTEGTGANCATGTADVTGVYQSPLGMALDFGFSPLRGSASQALCINQGTAVVTGGVVTYAYIP